MKFLITLLAITAFTATSHASVYSCKGVFEHKIDFELKTTKKVVTLSVPEVSCKTVESDNYRPTAKYEGYSRFYASDIKTCKAVTVAMLGNGNTFQSMKLSPELLSGEDEGELTLIYDFGDYHGQLANEKVHCELL